MRDKPNEPEIARPDSWKTVKMPTRVTSLSLNKTYTADEFSILARGFVPKEMEDKWFVFMQNNTLFFHCSWRGFCIYKVVFEQSNESYVVREAFVNRDTKQYNSTDNNYDTALLSWLIDGLLLHKRVNFPLPSNLPKDSPPGVFQHHIAGTAFPEVQHQPEGE